MQLGEESAISYDGGLSNPRIKNISYSYNRFGNTIEIHSKGDVSDSNDDKDDDD